VITPEDRSREELFRKEEFLEMVRVVKQEMKKRR